MFDNKNMEGSVLIETMLTCSCIAAVFNSILEKRLYSKAGMIVRLKQDKMCVSPLPKLTSMMRKVLVEKGLKTSDTDQVAMTKLFRERRKLVMIQLSFESVIVIHDEVLTLLKRKIVRQLTSGKLTKKCVDPKSFTSFLNLSRRNQRDETRNMAACRQICPHGKSLRSSTLFQNRKYSKHYKHTDTRTVSKVKPRKYHTPTVVNDDAKHLRLPNAEKVCNVSMKVGDVMYVVCPNDWQKYNEPLLPKDGTDRQDSYHVEDKFPTQVTEVDAGQLSLESSHRSVTRLSEGNPLTLQNNGYGDSQHRQSRSTTDRNIVSSGTGLPSSTKRPRYPDYILESKRLASFQTLKWDTDNKPDPSIHADCGFFFTGNLDLVRCHQCGIGLKDWNKEDDVLTEHVKYSTSCEFLLQKLGQSRLERMKTAVLSQGNERDALSSNATQLPYKIRSPRYQTMEARMASFNNFPQHISLHPQELAVAGLFYTGKDDLCRCFTCDGGLKDWSTGDDPVKEHAKYFQNCTYINQLKGRDYVRSLQQHSQDREPVGATGNYATQQPMEASNIRVPKDYSTYSSFAISQVVQNLGYAEIDVISAKAELEKIGNMYPTTEEVLNTLLDLQEQTNKAEETPSTHEDELQSMVEENLRLSNTIHCTLCANEADVLFLPCSHHRMCHECASVLEYCPVCDGYIQEKVKTFRS